MENNHNNIELNNKLPFSLALELRNKETSLGENPVIPYGYNQSFLQQIVNKEFEVSKNRLKKIGVINDVSEIDLQGALSHLILECQNLEKPYRNELEIICANLVTSLFRIPENMIEMNLHLVDQVNLNDESIMVDPIDGDDSLQFIDYDDDISIKHEVYKRRFLDMLSTGAGLSFSSRLKDYSNEIYYISPKLIDLYEKILALNSYLLFSKDDSDLDINDRNTRQIGTNVVQLGAQDEIVRIKAQGKIFPVLFAEAINGFMNLFSSHGLPDDMDEVRLILGKSDFIKAEPWDMRIGPALWNIFYNRFNIDKTEEIPYLFKEISQLNPQTFFNFMREMLLGTSKGDKWVAIIRKKAIINLKEDHFFKRLNIEKQPGIISDDISPLEL